MDSGNYILFSDNSIVVWDDETSFQRKAFEYREKEPVRGGIWRKVDGGLRVAFGSIYLKVKGSQEDAARIEKWLQDNK